MITSITLPSRKRSKCASITACCPLNFKLSIVHMTTVDMYTCPYLYSWQTQGSLLTHPMQINEDSEYTTAISTWSNADIPITQASHRSELAEIDFLQVKDRWSVAWLISFRKFRIWCSQRQPANNPYGSYNLQRQYGFISSNLHYNDEHTYRLWIVTHDANSQKQYNISSLRL